MSKSASVCARARGHSHSPHPHRSTGTIHFGINCFGVCGDADGNGDANGSSTELTAAGGTDNPDFKLSESVAIAMDMSGGVGGAPE